MPLKYAIKAVFIAVRVHQINCFYVYVTDKMFRYCGKDQTAPAVCQQSQFHMLTFPTMVTKFLSFACEQNLILKPTLLIHVSRCVKRSRFVGMREKTGFYAYIIGQLSLLCKQKLFRWYESQSSSVCLRY